MRILTRRGIALLEALVALVLLAIIGLSLLTTMRESERPVAAARTVEERLMAASHLLDAASLWSRSELDARLGSRSQGSFRLEIARPAPNLYHLIVRDTLSGRSLLSTRLFRKVAR